MLSELKIKNFVLVEDIQINFSAGMSVITGETGAGKSVIMGALHYVLGENIKSDVFFDKQKSIVLEATFSIDNLVSTTGFIELLSKHDCDIEGNELFFLREIKPDGKSSIYINGRKTTNSIVKDFRVALLDFHSQRDQQSLFDEETQLLYLDKYADLMDMRADFFAHYTMWGDSIKKLKKYQSEVLKNEEKKLLYEYQIAEIEATNLGDADEESALDSEYSLLNNAKEILELYTQMKCELFEGERTVFDLLVYYKNKLTDFSGDHKLITDTIENLANSISALEDVQTCVYQIEDEVNMDDERLCEIEQRIRVIYDIKNKYKRDIPQLLSYLSEMKDFLAGYEQDKEMESQLLSEIARLQTTTAQKAMSLHDKRVQAASSYQEKIISYLKSLAILEADFKIIIDKNQAFTKNNLADFESFSPTGIDTVRYTFSANKGSPLQDLKATISGGELSRLLLVIKSILAKKLPERTVVFDEIDSGIGGQTANMLGSFIRELSENHQILCISHLPQIAAVADTHYMIEKVSTTDNTMITLRKLDDDSRVGEIARMLSGDISETAIQHAHELLKK
jgi:DNA repair protein RecN (Recombination protein N)